MPTLNWIGKEAVVSHHREVPYHLLRCHPELSVGEEGHGNLLVEGDNLLALKALLPYYARKVKCIYIDPPYNTGNEGWVYNDNVNSPEMRKWLAKAVGGEAEDLSRHDKWLCMMYPRVCLLRQFLTDDGLIFVSVDENEHRHLTLLMDEVFGSRNRLETYIWKKSYGGGQKSKHVVNLHEYIVAFARDIDRLPPLELPPDPDVLRYYRYRDDQEPVRGPYRLQPLATTSMDTRPNLRYAIRHEGHEIWPEKQWQWSEERAVQAQARNELVIRRKGSRWTVNYKQYLRDADGTERGRKPYSIIDGIYTQRGTAEIKAVLGDGKAFGFPKPSDLIGHLLAQTDGANALILDSFAGSGTTGHAVLRYNAERNAHRRFILVEMEPEVSRQVTRVRLQRAIDGYEDTPGLGGGFRYCTLGEPLFDAHGHIGPGVRFADLAQHIYFTETGEPLPSPAPGDTPLIGEYRGTAFYLLWNGVPGGNRLTADALKLLAPHAGPGVVFADECRIAPASLARKGIVFRHIPYEVKVQ